MTDRKDVAPPHCVSWLGYGGLIPFLALAPASLLDDHHGAWLKDALFTYGAVILSFIGAIHWGFALTLSGLSERQRAALFLWSIMPALIAWLALFFSPLLAGPLLVLGFIAHYLRDARLASQATLPPWYLPLRLRLSGVAITCLAAGVF